MMLGNSFRKAANGQVSQTQAKLCKLPEHLPGHVPVDSPVEEVSRWIYSTRTQVETLQLQWNMPAVTAR